jgi:hypothetical protein
MQILGTLLLAGGGADRAALIINLPLLNQMSNFSLALAIFQSLQIAMAGCLG